MGQDKDPNALSFVNINTPDELEGFKTRLDCSRGAP
jgi:molybdopterin-guanine dinucleotide biosynthesis protein A